MKYRKLRIAWSVVCGIACVLLITLSVRSYWWVEGARAPLSATRSFQFGTLPGLLAVGMRNVPGEPFMVDRRQTADWRKLHSGPSQLWGGVIMRQSDNVVYLPLWILVVVSGAVCAKPLVRQLPKRFTTRTLLIATTLVALALGVIVWLR
jgi:hypothetical protein